MSMNAQPLPLRTTNYWILPREHHNCSNGPPQTFPHRVKSPRWGHEIPLNREFAPFSGIEVPQITTLENSIPKKHYTNPVFCSGIYCFSSQQRWAPLRLFSLSKLVWWLLCGVTLWYSSTPKCQDSFPHRTVTLKDGSYKYQLRPHDELQKKRVLIDLIGMSVSVTFC